MHKKKSFKNVTQGIFDEDQNLGIYFLGFFLGC
jgi:hypothetical protein